MRTYVKPKPGKLDMEAIAKLLGVSKTTVHYAIRNTGRLSDQTRKRVLKMVEAKGYRPDGLARSFRRRRSDTLGVVLVTLTNSFHAPLLEGAEMVAQLYKHTVLVSCSHGRSDVERELVEVLLEKGVDGGIVVPADPVLNRDYYQRLLDRGTRLVFVDREIPGLNAEVVCTDHEKGAYLEAQHLVGLGRKKILCIATRSPDPTLSPLREHFRGIDHCLPEAGLAPATVLGTDPPDWTAHEQYGY